MLQMLLVQLLLLTVQAQLDHKVTLVQQGQLVFKDHKDTLGELGQLVLKVHKVTLGEQGQQVLKDHKDTLGERDQQVLKVLKVLKVHLLMQLEEVQLLII